VISLTKIFDAFQQVGSLTTEDERYYTILEKWYIFAVIWSIGASVDEESRFIIDDTIKDIDSGFPHGQTLYEYTINLEKMDWMHW
jgi:dynein heavy chain